MEYTITGVKLTTERELPASLIKYMSDWAKDPIWDLWDTSQFEEYSVELMTFQRLYESDSDKKWNAKVMGVADLEKAKQELLQGDYEAANVRANIVIAEQLKRIADKLDSITQVSWKEKFPY